MAQTNLLKMGRVQNEAMWVTLGTTKDKPSSSQTEWACYKKWKNGMERPGWNVSIVDICLRKLLWMDCLDLLEWRKTTEQIDWLAKQPSQVACFSEDLKCWEAWDTTCGHKVNHITPSIAWRREASKEEALDDLQSLKEQERAIVNQTNIGTVSKGTLGKLLTDGLERICAFPSADTILNWIEMNSVSSLSRTHQRLFLLRMGKKVFASSHTHCFLLLLLLSWCFTSTKTIWFIRDGGKNGIGNESPDPPPCLHSSWAHELCKSLFELCNTAPELCNAIFELCNTLFGGGDSSVVRAPDSWLKGRGFESLLERRENFLLQGRLSVLTLISVSVPPPCYHSST